MQWLGLRASTAGETGLIPGQGTKIPQAKPSGAARKKKNVNTKGDGRDFAGKLQKFSLKPFDFG